MIATEPQVKIEVSFEEMIKVLDVEGMNLGTYVSTIQADGSLHSLGEGVVATADGELIAWKGLGVGRLGEGGSVAYSGSLSYTTTSQRFAKLNSISGVFQFEVDAQGNTRARVNPNRVSPCRTIYLRLHQEKRPTDLGTVGRVAPDVEALVVRIARETFGWGYDRFGQLGARVVGSDGGKHPAPPRHRSGAETQTDDFVEGFYCCTQGCSGRGWMEQSPQCDFDGLGDGLIAERLFLEQAIIFEESTEIGSDFYEFFVTDRLPKIARPELGGLTTINRRIRGRDDDHGKIFAFGAGTNSPEHFKPIHFRKIQIEEQQLRGRRVRILLRCRPTKSIARSPSGAMWTSSGRSSMRIASRISRASGRLSSANRRFSLGRLGSWLGLWDGEEEG